MDAFRTAFDKLRQLKEKGDSRIKEDDERQVAFLTNQGVPEEQAKSSTKLTSDFIQSGGMGGTVKALPSAAKVFRDPSVAKSLPPEARKAALDKLLGLIQSGKGSNLKKAGVIR